MRRQSQCPKCSKKTIRETGACVGCGGPLQAVEGLFSLRSVRRYGAGVLALLAMLAMLAVNYSDRYIPAMADWYLEMAVPYAESGWSHFAPAESDDRAFYACARSLVKRLDSEGTIATFPSPVASPTRSLGEGRFEIESYVREAGEGGQWQLRSFTCTLQYDGERWAVEDLRLKPFQMARAEP